MKLNLGSGRDVREGYVNVDFDKNVPADMHADLSQIPWPWEDESVEEILMLDFLEHFPYRSTKSILEEAWRILKKDGQLIIQVPDFEHCSAAILNAPELGFQCNRCGWWFKENRENTERCGGCSLYIDKIQEAAVHRLYGGQDRLGNWHFTTFTQQVLSKILCECGFLPNELMEYDHQLANWNFKLRSTKTKDVW